MATSRPSPELDDPDSLASEPMDPTLDAIRREAEFLGISVDEIVRERVDRSTAAAGGLTTVDANPSGSPPVTPDEDDDDDDDLSPNAGVLEIVRSPAPARSARATHSLPPSDARLLERTSRAAAVDPSYPHTPSDDGLHSVHSSELGSYESVIDAAGEAERRGWAADLASHYSDPDGLGPDGGQGEGEEELDGWENDEEDDAVGDEDMAIDPTLFPASTLLAERLPSAPEKQHRQANLKLRVVAPRTKASSGFAPSTPTVGGSSSSSSSTAGPFAADLLQQKHELERARALAAERQKVNGRRPVATKKGKFWKPAELPAEILSSILEMAYEDLYDYYDLRLPGTVRDRRTTHNNETGQLLVVAKARTDVVRWRLVSKAWRAATNGLSIWSELLELICGPQNLALRSPIRFDSTAFRNVWQFCWACIANDFVMSRAGSRTSTIHGPIYTCKVHGSLGGCCGRCLGDDDAPTEWIVVAPVAEPELYAEKDGASSSCQSCRQEILNECLRVQDQPPLVSAGGARPDGGLLAGGRYITDGTLHVLDAVTKVIEGRWLADWTPFTVYCDGAIDQRLNERPVKTKRDRADRRAIARVLRGDAELAAEELGDLLRPADKGENPLDALHAFEELTDEGEDDELDADEDDDLDSNGRPRLDDEELLQLARMAITTWTRDRILAGYWVSPNEHWSTYWQGTEAVLKRFAGRKAPRSADFDLACYRPLWVRQPLIGGDLSAPPAPAHVPHPKVYKTRPPSLALTADLPNSLSEAYVLQLEATLRPALNTLVSALATLHEPVPAAAGLHLEHVLGFVQLGFAWESGAAHWLSGALATGERKGVPAGVVVRQFIDATRPPSPLPSPAVQSPVGRPITSSTTSVADSPLIGPVQPSAAAPRSAWTSVGSATAGAEPSTASPESHAHSHWSGLSPAFSTPPTSTSPPPHDELLAKPVAVPTPAPLPVALPTRFQSHDPRPKTAAVPAIPVDLTELGRETVDHLARIWWRAWQPLTSCACPICARRSGRNDVGLPPAVAAVAAATTAATEPTHEAAAAGDMEADEMREMTAAAAGKGLNGGAKRKDEGGPTDVTVVDNEQGEMSPTRAKRARVDAPSPQPVDI